MKRLRLDYRGPRRCDTIGVCFLTLNLFFGFTGLARHHPAVIGFTIITGWVLVLWAWAWELDLRRRRAPQPADS